MQTDCSMETQKYFDCPYNNNFNCPYDTREEIKVDDQQLNVRIYTLGDIQIEKGQKLNLEFLPGKRVSDPINNISQCGLQCVQARANVTEVAKFILDLLYDTRLINYVASINLQSDEAFWVKPLKNNSPLQGQTVFGRDNFDQKLLSFANINVIVAHEFFHGVNYITTLNPLTKRGIEYKGESGAIDESYADIFAILFSNYAQSDIGQWCWEIGKGIGKEGEPIRDLSNPSKYAQPDHMNNYKYYLPHVKADRNNDYLGVHYNCGILNKAAYNLITSKDSRGQYIFDAQTVVQIFYRSLDALAEITTFSNIYVAILLSARTQFYQDKSLTDKQREEKIQAISKAFHLVGISKIPHSRFKKINLIIKQTWIRFKSWRRKNWFKY